MQQRENNAARISASRPQGVRIAEIAPVIRALDTSRERAGGPSVDCRSHRVQRGVGIRPD